MQKEADVSLKCSRSSNGEILDLKVMPNGHRTCCVKKENINIFQSKPHFFTITAVVLNLASFAYNLHHSVISKFQKDGDQWDISHKILAVVERLNKIVMYDFSHTFLLAFAVRIMLAHMVLCREIQCLITCGHNFGRKGSEKVCGLCCAFRIGKKIKVNHNKTRSSRTHKC